MALVKEEQIDSINVTIDNSLEIRKATLIKEDEIVLAKTYHRWVLAPGDDLTGQDEKVIAVANAVWSGN